MNSIPSWSRHLASLTTTNTKNCRPPQRRPTFQWTANQNRKTQKNTLSSCKCTSTGHSYTTTESSISGITCWSQTFSGSLGPTGTKKATLEHLRTSSTYTVLSLRFTWQTMQCKRIFPITTGMNLTTRYRMRSFRGIWIWTTMEKGITLRNKFYQIWKKWQQMPQKASLPKFLHRIPWTTLKYMDWISWLIRISGHGSSRSTPTPVLTAPALFSIESSLTWWNSLSNCH